MGRGDLCGKKSLICCIEKRSTPFLVLFFGLSALHLWAQLFEYSWLASGTKTLIIPALALWVFQRFRLNKQLGWALFFSWLGDLLLIPDGTPYFIAGILAFWAAQLLYCRMMMGHFEGSFFQQFRKKKAVLPLLLLGGYLIFILQLMWSRLGVLLVPVSLYATTLTVTGFLGLLMAAENRYKQTKILALGTLLFALSDSMIAFDAFYFERPQFTYWIMATYIPAQFCIALFLAPAQGEK